MSEKKKNEKKNLIYERKYATFAKHFQAAAPFRDFGSTDRGKRECFYFYVGALMGGKNKTIIIVIMHLCGGKGYKK